MPLDQIQTLNIKGFLDHEEGLRLHELASLCDGPCLEIGGYCGLSTAYLGLGCRQSGNMLYSIDHHRGSEEQQPGQEYFDPEIFDEREQKVDTFRLFRRTLDQLNLNDSVIPVVTSSQQAVRHWATPLSLLFIDGGHSYYDAFSDFSAWLTHVRPGGYLVIHDIFLDVNEGGQAPRFLMQRALDSRLFKEVGLYKTLGVLKRLEIGEVPDDILAIRDWG